MSYLKKKYNNFDDGKGGMGMGQQGSNRNTKMGGSYQPKTYNDFGKYIFIINQETIT